MLIKKYKSTFLEELSPLYDELEIESFFYLILESFHSIKRIDLALNPFLEMTKDDLKRWQNVVEDLKKEKPIQYALGETTFYGLQFEVNENTLIPRPETEELVDLIVHNTKKEFLKFNSSSTEIKPLKIIDIGTGSGCIAISLAKNIVNAKVYAVDVSEKAIETAKKNSKINEVTVDFIQSDILRINDLSELKVQSTSLDDNFDVIVSNPPYVRKLEKEEIKKNVLEYEPHLALFVEDDDALLFYRKIASLALNNLAENGRLYFEINQYLGNETVDLLTGYGFKKVELIKDVYGNNRMISAEK